MQATAEVAMNVSAAFTVRDPAPHARQVAALPSDWYVPEGQASQPAAAEDAAKNPLVHEVHPDASAAEYVPGKHTAQYATPSACWYRPVEVLVIVS